MNAEEVLNMTANVTILAIGVVLLAFIFLYGFFFNWRKTPGGRSVMYFVGALELLIMLAAFLNWVHVFSDETEQLLRSEVYLTILAAGVRMLWVLLTRWRTTGEFRIDVEVRRREGALVPKNEGTSS